MKNFIKTKWYRLGTYFLLVMATFLIGFILLNNSRLNHVITSFFAVAENRSFDYRQSIQIAHKRPIPNKDIIVLAIDDASLESLWEKYGEWPIPRSVYANIINHIEKDNPKAIIFDFMFIKSIKSTGDADSKLIEAMNKYNNVYTGINFDDQSKDVRLPINLPKRLSVNVTNNSNIKIGRNYIFSNCRAILPELINGSVNIGSTNVQRNNDGIIRAIAPFLVYKDNYYPYLTFLAGADYLQNKQTKDFVINKQGTLVLQNSEIPLTTNGEAILNWYGPSKTHTIYPMYKIINEMENNHHLHDFKNKIVLIGATAMSLQDTKSVPIQDSIYPGVEVHATFLNNMLDNNFIKKTNFTVNILILLSVITIVGIIVMLSTSTLFALLSTILFSIAYLFISYYIMELWNWWIPVVIPTIMIMIAFALSYLTKYLIKSRDFEYQYKLATIDGLTELYNHRYFQDTLRNQIEISKRYKQEFSLIIIDIDFFKKFNDTYGHQSGDAVLKQVAQTLKKNSRTTDYVCRYGGEEMSIILPNTNSQEAYNHAERILHAVADKKFQLNSTQTGNVTVSLGVSTFPQNGENAQDLIEYADKCLYNAKENGRNQIGKINKQD